MILTGENGTGKSSLIEAIYLLKKIMSENFQTTIEQHNGMTSITRQGTLFFSVELHAAGAQGELSYKIEIAHNKSKGYIVIQREELTLGPLKEREKPLYVIQRRGPNAKVFNQLEGRLVSVEVASHVSTLSINTLPPNQAIFRIKSVLDRILVYTPFLTSQSWLVSGSSVEARSRQPSKYQPITYVDRQGDNLANVLANLKLDHKQWSRLLDLVRIGLGSDIEDIDVTPLPAGGYVAASLRYKNNQQIPLSDISDGMMCYLLYVATQQLCLRAPPSLLMMDEIELHLHPGLIARTYLLLEELTRNNIPVLVTSHSDYLLDIVPDPIAQISVLVNDGANGSTTLALNADRYQEWLENYKGFGSMRLEGVDQFVLEER